jgi:anti-sigma factor RsiW
MSEPTEPQTSSAAEADRLIALALRDAREPAPAHLRDRLAKKYLPRRRPAWIVPALSAVGGAVLAAAILLLVVFPRSGGSSGAGGDAIASEAIDDHLRMLDARDLGVATNEYHNVKPWFAGKLDFTPPVTFLGDEDFPLRGGDIAIFSGHKAAAFAYGRRLHKISLFVYQSTAADAPHAEATRAGFHAITWTAGGFGYALVSDVAWDDLRTLAAKVDPSRSGS